MTTAIRAAASAAVRLLPAARSSGCSSKACRKLPSVGSRGIQVGWRLPSSLAGLKAVESSQRNGRARKTR